MKKNLKDIAVVLLFLCILDNSVYMFGTLYAVYTSRDSIKTMFMPLVGFLSASLCLLFLIPSSLITFENYSIGLMLQGALSLLIITKVKKNNFVFFEKFGWLAVILLNIFDLTMAHDFSQLVQTNGLMQKLIVSSLGYSLFANPIINLKSSANIMIATSMLYCFLVFIVLKMREGLAFAKDQSINKEISVVLMLDGSLRFITGAAFLIRSEFY